MGLWRQVRPVAVSEPPPGSSDGRAQGLVARVARPRAPAGWTVPPRRRPVGVSGPASLLADGAPVALARSVQGGPTSVSTLGLGGSGFRSACPKDPRDPRRGHTHRWDTSRRVSSGGDQQRGKRRRREAHGPGRKVGPRSNTPSEGICPGRVQASVQRHRSWESLGERRVCQSPKYQSRVRVASSVFAEPTSPSLGNDLRPRIRWDLFRRTKGGPQGCR